jgi:large subunit ribosomal protein L24
MKIKKNDNVMVIAGKDKGTKAKVLKAFPRLDKVVVEGVNVVKKHVGYRYDKKGEVIQKEMPIHVSNVKLVAKSEKKVAKTEKTPAKEAAEKPTKKTTVKSSTKKTAKTSTKTETKK